LKNTWNIWKRDKSTKSLRITAQEVGPKNTLEDFDGTRKSLHAGQPALLTGLNDAVKTFILLSYEHRV
jgi:hypothetical protein